RHLGLAPHDPVAEGVPLGLAAVKFWTRAKSKGTKALKRKVNPTRIPIEHKGSARWLETHAEPLVLDSEPAQLLLESREVPLARDCLRAAGSEGLLPAPEHALAQVEVAGDLGQAAALLGDAPDRLDLELADEGSPRSRDR